MRRNRIRQNAFLKILKVQESGVAVTERTNKISERQCGQQCPGKISF